MGTSIKGIARIDISEKSVFLLQRDFLQIDL
jgi:hypothetical protein